MLTLIVKKHKSIKSITLAIVIGFFCFSAICGEIVHTLTNSDNLAGRSVNAIEEDENGFIWFGTANGLSRYDGYEIKNFTKILDQELVLSKISTLKSYNDTLWIGTFSKGIYKYYGGELHKVWPKTDAFFPSVRGFLQTDEGLWVGTSKGLYFRSKEKAEFELYPVDGAPYRKIHQIIEVSSNKSLLLANKVIYVYESGQTLPLFRKDYSPELFTKLAAIDATNYLAVSGQRLYLIDISKKISRSIDGVRFDSRVLDLDFKDNILWVGTRKHGVLKVTFDKGFSNGNVIRLNGLSDNVVPAIKVDRSGTLWAGNFNVGVDYSPSINNINFNKFKDRALDECVSGNIVHSFLLLKDSTLFGTSKGIVKYSSLDKSCTNLVSKNNLTGSVNGFWKAGPNDVFAPLGNSLVKLDHKLETYKVVFKLDIPGVIYTFNSFSGALILGTSRGLFILQEGSDNLYTEKKLFPESVKTSLMANGKLVFSSKNTVYSVDEEFNIEPIYKVMNQVEARDLYFYEGAIWFIDSSHTITSISSSGVLNYSHKLSDLDASTQFESIIVSNETAWLGSNKGLYKLSLETSETKQFTTRDGLSSNNFSLGAKYKAKSGTLLFGTYNGIDKFNPSRIKYNLTPPKVTLTKFTRFNKEVLPNKTDKSFTIDSPIEYLKKLELRHSDYVVGFEFAGLHFADPERNLYQYKLEGFHDDWISTDADNRTATFTNLPSGEYIFRVKAANKDGIWSLNEDSVALKIKIHPAPWFTWWAFLIYAASLVIAVLGYVRFRTRAAVARAEELKKEVSNRTKEIQTQKNVIESLLERKNELFANISHEFRTPLTLILGPLEKELKALSSPKDPKHLNMIKRNANRLLGMVEQILKLTELKKEQSITKIPYEVNATLEAIIESFEPLAESKNIALSLQLDLNCNILAAKDALEVMIGNLVSNAIKYTAEGGKVIVTAKLLNKKIQISVTDSGVGMTQKQKEEVFERFVRLDKTSDIAGTGIGLSIVKELILAHDGEVAVESVEGQGSTFTINLPTTEQAALSLNQKLVDSIGHLTAKTEESQNATPSRNYEVEDNDLSTILVIEDNKDMQEHIISTLDEYHCITADRGQQGLTIAQDKVPDLVICDVMMPGMDGYEVARQLRNDSRTSHIPIVLLTAKGDKESRIQGWNENIDDYMTKPFDERELKTRLSNILAVRNLLGSKVGELVTKEKEFLDKKDNLNKRDALFLERLKADIEKNYGQQGYARSAMASAVALSERQFQRKLKALANKTPMELLREYRLNKAAEFLKEGNQVGVVADKCGFSSISHFSISFKAFFEKTPKQYQSETIS